MADADRPGVAAHADGKGDVAQAAPGVTSRGDAHHLRRRVRLMLQVGMHRCCLIYIQTHLCVCVRVFVNELCVCVCMCVYSNVSFHIQPPDTLLRF